MILHQTEICLEPNQSEILIKIKIWFDLTWIGLDYIYTFPIDFATNENLSGAKLIEKKYNYNQNLVLLNNIKNRLLCV